MKRPFKSSLSSKTLLVSTLLTIGLSSALVGCNQTSDTSQQAPTSSNAQESTNTADTSSVSVDDSISDSSDNSAAVQEAQTDERLGTEWGDNVNSHVNTVELNRTSYEPVDMMQTYYADKDYAGREINTMSLLNGKVEFSMIDDTGSTLPMFRDNGNYYVQGQEGQAYILQYHNNSDDIYEIVASVDGLDVISGSEASRYNGGYVLYPYDELIIEGFRRDEDTVASFVFSQPNDAYAANTSAGSINNTGVIGTVVYELYDPTKPQNTNPQAFPADNGYAQPPS